MGVVASDATGYITKANDGSLIIKFTEETAGFVLVVPFYALGEKSWARFEASTK